LVDGSTSPSVGFSKSLESCFLYLKTQHSLSTGLSAVTFSPAGIILWCSRLFLYQASAQQCN